jgi:hypothetical protein
MMLCSEAQNEHVKVEGKWKVDLRVRVSVYLPRYGLHVLVSDVTSPLAPSSKTPASPRTIHNSPHETFAAREVTRIIACPITL